VLLIDQGSAHKLLHNLFAKRPVFWGLLQIDYGLAQKLLGILSAKCPVFISNVRLGFCKKLNDETWIELGFCRKLNDETWMEFIRIY